MDPTQNKKDARPPQGLSLLMHFATLLENRDHRHLDLQTTLAALRKLREETTGLKQGIADMDSKIIQSRICQKLETRWPAAPAKKKWKYHAQMSYGVPPTWIYERKTSNTKLQANLLDSRPPPDPSIWTQKPAKVNPEVPPRKFVPPAEAAPFEKSCNNFTTALDEHKANLHEKGKKYEGFPSAENSNPARIDPPPRPTAKNGVLGVDFYGSGNHGDKKEVPATRRQFKPPIKEESKKEAKTELDPLTKFVVDEGLDPSLVEVIQHEIIDNSPPVKWEDIAGLEEVKKAVNETIIFPNLRPELFTGLRKPGRGILLFGPPGTGKTMIGRAIAGQLGFTFFSISSSSLISKWVGETEKLIRTLFRMAIFYQPSIIFVDEIDSMLSVRGDSEADVVRRIKTEFFVQIDGAKTNENDKLLVIGTTNRPEQLDEAARRRFTKRLYVPLPDLKARLELFKSLVNRHQNDNGGHPFSELDLEAATEKSEGYSCADILNVMKDAAMIPVRELLTKIGPSNISLLDAAQVRPLQIADIMESLAAIKASVATSEIHRYIEWNQQFGTSRI